uniref:Ring finger protein 17 n=1 Tax=Pygocentrus nattereri TaxID=42514 RepID=A0A3B4DBK2_PYGNA
IIQRAVNCKHDEVVGNVPHVLHCGHIFCTVCLRTLESPRGFIACPECKMGTNVGEEGVDGLQVDSRIIGLIYTAKMNTKKREREGDKHRARRFRSPSASPPDQEQQSTEVSPDVLEVLDEALCKATENLNTLDSLYQVRGPDYNLYKFYLEMPVHVPDACIDQKMRGVLMSEIGSVEQLFSAGWDECQRVEDRRKELFTAIQKARHVRQVPSLGTYCHLDKILKTLQTPVDAESYDMSCLTVSLQEWVVLTHIINPTHFYVRHVSERKAGTALARKINKLCSGEESCFTAEDEINTGVLVLVRWKDDVWCRAVVCELFQNGCLESVTQCPAAEVARLRVFFQDYGFSKGFSFSGLSGLNECLRKADVAAKAELHRWAPQAIKCSLKDIIPSDLVNGWSREACDEMRRVIGSSAVEMQVFGEDRDTLLVDLKKPSVDDTLLSLREHLVFMELARFYSPLAAPGGGKPLLFYPPVYPKLNTELPAVVSHVNTPSDFYIQLVDNMEFLLLNSKLQDCYGSPGSDSELQIYCPVQGQACVAIYDEKDWCRAQVTGFPGGRMVEVRYVDFGNRKTLSVNDLRQIKDEFFALPAMAVWCSLADVLSVGDSWSDESIQVFRKLTEQKLVIVVVTKLVPQSAALPVRLFEVSESFTELQASIGETLVRQGLACWSKQTQLKDPPPLEAAVWDPPLDEVTSSPAELTSHTDEPSELLLSLILPTCLKDLRVKVTHVTSPGHIYVQLLQFDAHLKRVHDLLKREFSKSDLQEVDWKVDMPCAANVNGVWERGKVCTVSSSNISEVLRCDFGNTVKLHTSNLRPLLPELVGSLLLECCLSDIRPAGGRSTWTATACDFISYYLTGATAVMTIKDPCARPALVSLFCSNRSGQDVSIADFLISEGLALRERKSVCEEGGVTNETPTPSYSCPPRPAPRTAPPPERVKTQAYLPPELPPCGHTLMSISAVSDDGVIYAMTPQSECEFERLMECLQQHIKTLPQQKRYNWKSVLGCAVMGSDMLWYRGQVLEVIRGHVKVRYVDQGIVENIPVCHVYPVVLCEDVPQLCVPCQINGVVPIGGAWQWDAVALMKDLLLGRSVSVQVIELPENLRGMVTVEIMLDGMALSRIMVHHQHATIDPPISSLEDYVVKPPAPDLDNWDLNTEGLEEPQTVLGVYTNPRLQDKGKHFRVTIKHIRTPNEVVLLDLTASEQEPLVEALQQVNRDIGSLTQLTDFPIEGPCLAEYSDGKYYRAKLLGFAELNPCVKILVRHVDFGSDDILPPCKLSCLPPALLRFPCEAVCVRLAGFKPPRVCVELERISYRPEWSMKSMLEMIDLLHGDLSAVVTAVEPQLTVVLYNMDGTLVHMPLVEKGLADYE